MHAHEFFLQVMIILVGARLLAEFASRLNAPPVIGELAAGIILGPSLLGWLEPSESIRLLAGIGILLLLFEVGVETDIAKLARTGMKSFAVAAVGFIAPLAFGFSAAWLLFDQPLVTSLFIGGTLTATSIGITVRVLADLGRNRNHEARIVIGAAVLDDILGVVLLALLYDFSTKGSVTPGASARVLAFIVAFIVLAPVAGSAISSTIEALEKRTRLAGLLPTMMIALLLFSAWSAHMIGAPELLGGFAAGVAVSRYFYLPFAPFLQSAEDFAHRVEEQMKPIVHLFTPIFFVSVGLSLNLREVDWSSPFVWTLSSALLVIAFAGKVAAGFVLPGENRLTRWAVGLAMVPRGEVGLIFAEIGRAGGIFNQDVYAALLVVIALTTLLPPFLLRWFYNGPGRALPA